MTPIGHVGMSLPVGRVLKLNLLVVFICSLPPDIIDKFLWALGIGSGHYIGHALVFILLLVAGFSLCKRAYGLSALSGGVSYLLTDPIRKLPWLYPFAKYDFPNQEFNPSPFFLRVSQSFRDDFTLPRVSKDLMSIAIPLFAVYAISKSYS